jgi:alkylation response protein AidB-like acyl-CoA dehydrogenase
MTEIAAALAETAARILTGTGSRTEADVQAAFAEAGLDRPFSPGDELQWRDLAGVVLAIGRHDGPAALADAMAADAVVRAAGLRIDGRLTLAAGRLRRDADGRITGELPAVAGLDTALHVVTALAGEVIILDRDSLSMSAAHANLADEVRHDVTAKSVRPVALAAQSDDDPALIAGAAMRALLIAGAAERATATTLQYTAGRQQFDRPLDAFQAIQHNLARLAEETLAARAIALAAAYALGTPQAPVLVAAARVRTAKSARLVAEISHQCHGAMGFTHDYGLHRATRRLLAWRAEFGPPRQWSDALGGIIGSAGGDLWGLATGRRRRDS